MKNIIYSILLISLGCSSVRSIEPEINSSDHWRAKFDVLSKKKISYIKELSLSNDSRKHYNLSYYLDAYGAMYKVTNDEEYISTFFLLTENLITTASYSSSLRESQYKDNYLGWVDKSSPLKKNHGGEYPLYESYCWRYITDMLLYLSKNNEILNQADYRKRYNAILIFTEKHIFEKWNTRGENNLYRSNTHMFSHWARIGWDLHKITNKAIYKPVYKEFNNRMKNKIKLSDDGLKKVLPFTSFWNRKKNVVLDSNHANATVGAIIKMYDGDQDYKKETIDGLITLFDQVIWKDSETYAKYIDGSGKGTGSFSDGWIKLGRYDSKLQKRLESHNRGRSIQFFANLCYNAHFLNEEL